MHYPRKRKRGESTKFSLKGIGVSMNLLLFGVLLSHLGTYMVVPLLPIYLKL